MTLEWELKEAQLAWVYFEAAASPVIGGVYIVTGHRRPGGGRAKGFFISHKDKNGDTRPIVQGLVRDETEARMIAEAHHRRAVSIATSFGAKPSP